MADDWFATSPGPDGETFGLTYSDYMDTRLGSDPDYSGVKHSESGMAGMGAATVETTTVDSTTTDY